MADTEQEIRGLRETIARLISTLEVWKSLYDVCKALGLQTQENDHDLSKVAYLHKTCPCGEKEPCSHEDRKQKELYFRFDVDYCSYWNLYISVQIATVVQYSRNTSNINLLIYIPGNAIVCGGALVV